MGEGLDAENQLSQVRENIETLEADVKSSKTVSFMQLSA